MKNPMEIFPPDTYQVGGYMFRLDLIPVEAIHPLTDAWDHMECPICEEVYYKIGVDVHTQTHLYREPLWLRVLKKMMGREI